MPYGKSEPIRALRLRGGLSTPEEKLRGNGHNVRAKSWNFVNWPRNLRLTWQDCWHLVLEFATRNVTLRVRWNQASDGVYDRIYVALPRPRVISGICWASKVTLLEEPDEAHNRYSGEAIRAWQSD